MNNSAFPTYFWPFRNGKLIYIDAMYHTTMYSLALFQVMVRTSVGYVTVAHFLCESENSHDIALSINCLREWMTQEGLHWHCDEIMSDKSVAIENALNTSFPG